MDNESIIANHVEKLREKYKIDKYPNEVLKKCNECDFENMKFADENGFWYDQISLTRLGIPEPFHKASLIELNNKRYLIDPTYGQFFENDIFRDYMFSNYKDFSSELLDKGYIEFSFENILSYINGFIFSGAYTEKIDKDVVYSNLERLLLYRDISDREVDDVKLKLIYLLKLKKELLENSNLECRSSRGR